MRRVAFSATNVVAPVFAAAEVVVLFLPGMAGKTIFRNFLRRFVLEGNDFCRIAFFGVRLTWAMAGFASGHFILPRAYAREFRV
ncbi:MAG: hypothetical protein QOF62_2540 [Pyrinomonadaceae bacterium]|nr:hypothetical protein [Pyrinomonadaceae bacterium]